MNDSPLRPTIPPIMWFAFAMWTGCVLAEWGLWAVMAGDGIRACAVFALAVASAVLAAVSLRRRGGHTPALVFIVCAGLLTGLAVSSLQSLVWFRQVRIVVDCGAREWQGVVEADPMPGAYGTVARVRIDGGPLDGARARIAWPQEVEPPELGRTVRFSAIVKALPTDEPWARRTARAGVCGTGTAWRAEVGPWRRTFTGPLYSWRARMLGRMHSISGPGGDLAEGIVLGDRRRLVGTATEEDFRILGLTHLVAVSGSHLALACAAVAFLGTTLHVRRRHLVPLTVAAGAAYAVVTGLPFSALRSLLMLLVAGIGEMGGRRGDGVASLSVAVVGVLIIEPWAVFDLGFQLSALAVGGLLLFGGLATAWMTTGVRGPRRLAGATLALTLVAQLATVPVVASGFAMVSLLAPIANAIVSPLVSVALLLGLSGAVIGDVVASVGRLGSESAAAILGATAWIAEGMACLPGAAIAMRGGPLLWLATAGLAVAVWIRWPVPRDLRAGRRAMAALGFVTLALAVGPAPARQASVTVLDVGQGDAILVRDGGRTMLVDAAGDPLALREALARERIRRVDTLVLTHAHADHTGGASGLSGIAEVGWIGVPGIWKPVPVSPMEARRVDPMPGTTGWLGPDVGVRALRAGDQWRIGRITVRVLWPPVENTDDLKTNDTSVVLHISRGEFDMVLSGDAEDAAQRGMQDTGVIAHVEVLKVPHHGSSNGLCRDALEGWSPSVALISVGAGNDFGHPSPSTLAMLSDERVRVLRTDLHGDLTVVIGRGGYRVTTSRRGGRSGVRARMDRIRQGARGVALAARTVSVRGLRGRQDHRGAEAGLSDLRRRGASARSRAPPFAGPHRRGC